MFLLHLFTRSLHRQLVLLAIGVLVILTLVLAWVIETNLHTQLETLETKFVQKDMDRLVDLLEDQAHELESAITVWSSWDDAWQFMVDRNPTFIQSNFAPGTLLNSNIEFMTFWHPSGTLHFGVYEQSAHRANSGVPPWIISSLQKEWPYWHHVLQTTRRSHGILITPSGTLVLTAQPVVHTNGAGPAHGLIIAGYRLDEQAMAELRQIVHSDFKLMSIPEQASIPINIVNTDIQHLDEANLQASRVMLDIYKRPSIRVTLRQPRPIYQEGKRNLHTMLMVVTLLSMILLLTAFALIDKRVIQRIRALSNAVKSVSLGGSPSLLPVTTGGDDIDSLQREVKALFETQFAQQQELLDARIHAETANMAKRQFLARMSHEIRTPLNGIIGTASLLETTPMTDEQQEYLTMIQSSSSLLLELVNDTLDFSKIESGKVRLEHIPFNLEKELKQLIQVMQPRITEKNLAFYVYLSPDTPLHVVGDPYRLRQILINLLSNASKFTQTGHILLSVDYINLAETHHRPFFNFVVEDTGMGVSLEHQFDIFKEFEQADTSISRNYGGSGLGLAICKQLAEMMDSNIGVESQLGRGCRFWLHAHLQVDSGIPLSQPSPLVKAPTVVLVQPTSVSQAIFCRYLQHWQLSFVQLHSLDALQDWVTTAETTQNTMLVCDAQWLQDDADRERVESIYTTYFNPQPWVILSRTAHRQRTLPGNPKWLTRPVLPSALYQVLQSGLYGDEGAPQDVPDTSLKPTETAASGGCILIVEDNAINQKVLERMVTLAGYRAVIANHGEEALLHLSRQMFDLVLMDCHMPVMDGFETTVKIRAGQQPYAHVPIVAVTGNAIETELEKCRACGMNDTLTKPINKDQLFEKIAYWIQPSVV